jgi:hypothetical protein
VTGRSDACAEAGHGPLVEHPISVKQRGHTRDVLGELCPARPIHDIATDAPKVLHYVTVKSPEDVERLLTKHTFTSSLRYAIVFRDPLDEKTVAVYVPETETVRMYEDGIFGIVFPT